MYAVFSVIFLSANKFNKVAFIIAVITASLIATYTLLDGIAVRTSENPFTFIYWMLLLNGIPILIYASFTKNGLRKKGSYNIKDGIVAGIPGFEKRRLAWTQHRR